MIFTIFTFIPEILFLSVIFIIISAISVQVSAQTRSLIGVCFFLLLNHKVGRKLTWTLIRRHEFADWYMSVIRSFSISMISGCAVRLETRRSRVQPPPRSATFFRGD